MAKASDNPYPSVLVVEGSAPTSPPSGDQRLFIDSADHKLKRVDSAGTVTTVEGAASGNDVTLVEEATPSSPSSGSQKLFIDSADHTLKRVNSSGTVTALEGASGSPWTQTLNNDLSTMTGLTGLSGTWANSGGVLRQTDTTAATVRRLKYNTAITYPPIGIVEVEMKYNARSTGSTRMGLLHKFDGAGSSGYLTYLVTTDGTTWTVNTESDAVANVLSLGSVAYTSGNWAKLRVLYNLSYWVAYLDGTLLAGAPYSPSNGAPASSFVGLYTYGCDASFRNLKVWAPTMPA